MGAQASKPVAGESPAAVIAVNEKSPAYTTSASGFSRGASGSKAVVARHGHGHGREMDESLVMDDLHSWNKSFESNPVLALSRLVLSDTDPVQSLLSRKAVLSDPHIFNLMLKGVDGKGTYPGPRTDQASSGRCWLFATLNVLRYNVVEKLNLGDFELSQNHLFFYDKLEKANYYLECMIDLKDEPMDSRLVSMINGYAMYDGGAWEMAISLILKYGMVPHSICPDTHSAISSSRLDSLLSTKLREYTTLIRSSASAADARSLKSQFLAEVYNVCAVTLGVPPKPDELFTWEYNDRDGKYHSWTGTPKQFYKEFGKRKHMDPKDAFSLVHDPRNEEGKVYMMDKFGLGNVLGRPSIKYVNTSIEALEDATIACIRANTPLFFGSDVGRSSHSATGIMDSNLYPIETAYGFKLNMTKAERLSTGESTVTHAMVITAVHLDEKTGRPIRYRVENSWSAARGDKGWFLMTADWFRENVYQIVVPRSLADKKLVQVWDEGEVVYLEPWDVMCGIARCA